MPTMVPFTGEYTWVPAPAPTSTLAVEPAEMK